MPDRRRRDRGASRPVDESETFLPGTEVVYSDDGTVAKVEVPTPGSGTDAASVAALEELREDIIPATVGQAAGTTVNVSGDAASSEDWAKQLNDRLPLIFAFVFALAFLLMLVTFRSIVIPLKAITLNLLSVAPPTASSCSSSRTATSSRSWASRRTAA